MPTLMWPIVGAELSAVRTSQNGSRSGHLSRTPCSWPAAPRWLPVPNWPRADRWQGPTARRLELMRVQDADQPALALLILTQGPQVGIERRPGAEPVMALPGRDQQLRHTFVHAVTGLSPQRLDQPQVHHERVGRPGLDHQGGQSQPLRVACGARRRCPGGRDTALVEENVDEHRLRRPLP